MIEREGGVIMITFNFILAILFVLFLGYRSLKIFNDVAEEKVMELKGHSSYRVLFELTKIYVFHFMLLLSIYVVISLVTSLALKVILYILSEGIM